MRSVWRKSTNKHKTLFDLLNRAWVDIVRRVAAAEMLTIISDLEKYTISHFVAEETFMRVTNYADFKSHKRSHDDFVARIAAEKRAVQTGAVNISLDLVRFLKDWLVDHILVSDKAYANAFQKAKEPQSVLGRFFKRLLG